MGHEIMDQTSRMLTDDVHCSDPIANLVSWTGVVHHTPRARDSACVRPAGDWSGSSRWCSHVFSIVTGCLKEVDSSPFVPHPVLTFHSCVQILPLALWVSPGGGAGVTEPG